MQDNHRSGAEHQTLSGVSSGRHTQAAKVAAAGAAGADAAEGARGESTHDTVLNAEAWRA